MLGQDALEDVLGIEGPVRTDPREMAQELRMTRFPPEKMDPSEREEAFAQRIAETFEELGVETAPFEDTLTSPPIGRLARWIKDGTIKTLKNPLRVLPGNGQEDYSEATTPGLKVIKDIRIGPKIEPGTVVLAAGQGETGDLPVDYMGDFRDVTILTVFDQPDDVEEGMPFTDHYDKALRMFTYHMTNVVVGVGEEKWFIYNFNGSHPFYDRDGDLEHQILHSLVPKLAAPIRPPKLEEFEIREHAFEPTDDEHAPIVDDLVSSGTILEESDLYPPGRDLDELVWRNAFYRWAGRLHLDDRSGMSYGFLARQMPTSLEPVWTPEEAERELETSPPAPGESTRIDERLVTTLETPEGPRTLRVPRVRAMTLRSGCDKTDPHPREDLVKLGLEDGQMIMETPEGIGITEGYRPSFDTKVILAHAVGNALIASMLAARDAADPFARQVREDGMALAHWHGYPNPEHLPEGWHVHGADKPHVSCGTPQSALFALEGKLEAFQRALAEGEGFRGDVHIEPQHGTNLTYPTLQEVGRFLTKGEDVAGLGNKYLDAYQEKAKARSRAPA